MPTNQMRSQSIAQIDHQRGFVAAFSNPLPEFQIVVDYYKAKTFQLLPTIMPDNQMHVFKDGKLWATLTKH